jgi:hypothetical protein
VTVTASMAKRSLLNIIASYRTADAECWARQMRHTDNRLPRRQAKRIMHHAMAKAALTTLIRKSEEMLGLLCTQWERAGLTEKRILRKAKPFTDAIRQASEELGRRHPPSNN